MPDPRSVLGNRYVPGRAEDGEPGVTLCELTGWDLLQAAAWRGGYDTLRGRVEEALGMAAPDGPGRCATDGDIELITAAPLRLWCIGSPGSDRLARLAAAVDAETGCVTPLGHSHTRIRLAGTRVRRLLAHEVAIDLSPERIPSGTIVRTSFHHAPVMVQCINAGAGTFDLYVTRTFAASTWEYLLDLATAHGYEILERRRHVRSPPVACASTGPDR